MTVRNLRTLVRFERRSALAFVLAGAGIFASLVVPVALDPLTDWSWASGLVFLGLAIVTVSVGLVGLYPMARNRAPLLALAGAGAAIVAGIAALGLVGLVGVALGSQLHVGPTVSDPMTVFVSIGLTMTGGVSMSLLCFGVAIRRTHPPEPRVDSLLLAGGFALLVPFVVESVGVRTPLWVLFPVIVAFALDTVVIGHRLGARTEPSA